MEALLLEQVLWASGCCASPLLSAPRRHLALHLLIVRAASFIRAPNNLRERPVFSTGSSILQFNSASFRSADNKAHSEEKRTVAAPAQADLLSRSILQ